MKYRRQKQKRSLVGVIAAGMMNFACMSAGMAQETSPSSSGSNAPATATSNEGSSEAAAATTGNQPIAWPCMQRLQPELSVGAMWTGPDPTAASDEWHKDAAVQALVNQVAPRRVPQQEAIDAIHRFAAGYDKNKTVEMTRLFAGLFETLNEERSAIIRGIRHFHDRQQKLADRIQETMKAMDALDPNSTDQKVAEQRAALQDVVTWDSRIFDDREKLLPMVCDQPIVIERRLFALSRAIGSEIGKGN